MGPSTRTHRGSVLFLAALIPGLAVGSQAQRTVAYEGVVINQASGSPVANALIEAIDVDRPGLIPAPPAIRVVGEARSDTAGRFSLTTAGRADRIRAFTEQPPYSGTVKLRRWAKRRELVVELSPQLGISTYEGCPGARPTEPGDLWETATRARRALGKILAHRDRFDTSLRSLKEYYENGSITAKELALFQDHRDVFTRPCDTTGEARLVWGRRELSYGAIETPVFFVEEAGCGDCITKP